MYGGSIRGQYLLTTGRISMFGLIIDIHGVRAQTNCQLDETQSAVDNALALTTVTAIRRLLGLTPTPPVGLKCFV